MLLQRILNAFHLLLLTPLRLLQLYAESIMRNKITPKSINFDDAIKAQAEAADDLVTDQPVYIHGIRALVAKTRKSLVGKQSIKIRLSMRKRLGYSHKKGCKILVTNETGSRAIRLTVYTADVIDAGDDIIRVDEKTRKLLQVNSLEWV